MEDGAINNCQI